MERIKILRDDPPRKGVIGLLFLTYDGKDTPVMQGKVIGSENGFYLCQFFSWLDGRPTDIGLTTLPEMKRWKFFDDETEWTRQATKDTRRGS